MAAVTFSVLSALLFFTVCSECWQKFVLYYYTQSLYSLIWNFFPSSLANAIEQGAIGNFVSFRECVFERNVAVEYGGAVGFISTSSLTTETISSQWNLLIGKHLTRDEA